MTNTANAAVVSLNARPKNHKQSTRLANNRGSKLGKEPVLHASSILGGRKMVTELFNVALRVRGGQRLWRSMSLIGVICMTL